MDYNNIFENYELIKNKVNKLLNSVDINFVKSELDKVVDLNLKKIVKTHYLYLFQKKMNLLTGNKSIIIIQLEHNIKLIEKKSIEEKMDILNKLGYNEILLLLLNIDIVIIEKIKIATHTNSIKYNIIEEDNTNQEEHLYKLIKKIAEEVLYKYKNENIPGSNNVNIIYKNKNIDLEDDMKLNKSIYENEYDNGEDEDDNGEDEDEDEDEEDYNGEDEVDINTHKAEMKQKIPTIFEKEENVENEDVDGVKTMEKKNVKIVLSKIDLGLLDRMLG